MPGCASLPMAACTPFRTLDVARCRAIKLYAVHAPLHSSASLDALQLLQYATYRRRPRLQFAVFKWFSVAIHCITSRALLLELWLRCALHFDQLLGAEISSAWRAQKLNGIKRPNPIQCDHRALQPLAPVEYIASVVGQCACLPADCLKFDKAVP